MARIGFFSILGLVFIVLKLTNYINWSWGWVLFPFYGPLLVYLIIVIVVELIKSRL